MTTAQAFLFGLMVAYAPGMLFVAYMLWKRRQVDEDTVRLPNGPVY